VIQKLRNYLESHKSTPEGSYPLKQEMQLLVDRMCSLSNLNIDLNLSNFDSEKVDTQFGHDIMALTTEAISNSIRHSSSSKVTIRLERVNRVLKLIIQDNGTGCDIQKIKAGHGLENMKHRAKNHLGIIQLDSKPTEGFKVIIEFPQMTTPYPNEDD